MSVLQSICTQHAPDHSPIEAKKSRERVLGFREAMAAGQRQLADADYFRAAEAFADAAERAGDDSYRYNALRQAYSANRLRQSELEQTRREVREFLASSELEAAALLTFRVLELTGNSWEEFQGLVGIFEQLGEWDEIAFQIAVFRAETLLSEEQDAWLARRLRNAQLGREREACARRTAGRSYFAETAPYPLVLAFQKAACLKEQGKWLEAADIYAEIDRCGGDDCARMRALYERALCHKQCGYEFDSLLDVETVLKTSGEAAKQFSTQALALKLSISIDLGAYFVAWQSRELIAANRELWALYDLALERAASLYRVRDELSIRAVQSIALADEEVLSVWMRYDIQRALSQRAELWPAEFHSAMCLLALSGLCEEAIPLVPSAPDARRR